jgi:hypothetical protein
VSLLEPSLRALICRDQLVTGEPNAPSARNVRCATSLTASLIALQGPHGSWASHKERWIAVQTR